MSKPFGSGPRQRIHALTPIDGLPTLRDDFNLDVLIEQVVSEGASDIHFKAGSPPILRLQGTLHPLEGHPPLGPGEMRALMYSMLGDDEARLQVVEETGAVDFSWQSPSGVRLRVNAFRERGNIAIACRPVPVFIKSFEELNLPRVLGSLSDEERGLILVTGTTGSGKTTTLASMIDWINERKSKHIVTIEDPIEFVHADKHSVIAQREIGRDTPSFHEALRYVLRQDPDVILVGEMRDEETVRTALSAAQTGHLVLSTLHTLDASETITRIIDFFPPHMHMQARAMLAGTLKGIVSQRLVKTSSGDERVPAVEVLRNTARVEQIILYPDDSPQSLDDVIAEGSFYGMQTFDQALLRYVQNGLITLKDAMPLASRPHDLKLMFQSGGERSSSMANVDMAVDEPS
jgi:twitching motility protein PilT